MTNVISFKKEVWGPIDLVTESVTHALKAVGFGVLTRIDLHTKIKERIGKALPPTIILGACNPQLAYEAYVQNADVASLLPCNVVIRELGVEHVSVEIVKPSTLMKLLGDEKLVSLTTDVDQILERLLEQLPTSCLSSTGSTNPKM